MSVPSAIRIIEYLGACTKETIHVEMQGFEKIRESEIDDIYMTSKLKELNENNIQYNHQKIFQDCKHIRPLPFDFYLLNYNICIEYQGKQHYEPIEYFGGQKSFENQVLRDNIKKQYCKEHNIPVYNVKRDGGTIVYAKGGRRISLLLYQNRVMI